MHIPDGTITGYPLLIYAILAIILIALVVYRSKDRLDEKNIVQIAFFVVAAVIVQAIELPLVAGACIHISLITIISLYDLKTSVIVYTCVTIIQAFLLGEGGVSTLGIDLLNLAIIGPFVAYGVYHLVNRFTSNKEIPIILSAFITIVVLGLAVSIEYAIAGTYPINYGLVTIIPVEAVVGVLEAVVTVFVMRALSSVRPELVPVYSQ